MEIIEKVVDDMKIVKVGEKKVVAYKGLDGNIYDTEEYCKMKDVEYLENVEKEKFKNEIKYKDLSDSIFPYVLIFVKDFNQLKKFHKSFNHNTTDYYTFPTIEINNEWICVEYEDGGDSTDYTNYYRFKNIKCDILNFIELVEKEA